MDFIFIGLTLGCTVFLGKIVMDYLNEVPVWKEKIDQADIEMAQYEAEIQDLTAQKENASAQGKTIDEDIAVFVRQQTGFRSRGFKGVYLSNQESRVGRYHELIDDYIEGRRPE